MVSFPFPSFAFSFSFLPSFPSFLPFFFFHVWHQSVKTRLGADCGSDHELLIAKFRLKLKKVGKITRPFRYNRIPYDYTVEGTNSQEIRSDRVSEEEHWSGLPFPSPGDLPHPGLEPTFLTSPSLAGVFFPASATWEAHVSFYIPISDVSESSSCFKSLPTSSIDHFFNCHHSNIVYRGVNFCFPHDKLC